MDTWYGVYDQQGAVSIESVMRTRASVVDSGLNLIPSFPFSTLENSTSARVGQLFQVKKSVHPFFERNLAPSKLLLQVHTVLMSILGHTHA